MNLFNAHFGGFNFFFTDSVIVERNSGFIRNVFAHENVIHFTNTELRMVTRHHME